MPITPGEIIGAIIFDHDGTLVNSEPVHLARWQSLLDPYGAQLTTEEYHRFLSGRPSLASAEWLVNRFALPVEPDVLFQQKHRAMCAWLSQQACPLMDGARTLLEHLQAAGVPLALASGASQAEVQASLKYHQLQNFFPVVTTREQVTHNKPAPDVYLLAAGGLGLAPEQCLAIEDSDSGQLAAQAAGMVCLRLDTHTELNNQTQCHTLPDLIGVKHWLQSRNLLSVP